MNITSTLLAALTLSTLATPACASISPPKEAPAQAMDSVRQPSNTFKPSIFTFESDANGFNTKTFFYDNGQEVVAFDTQFTPELAARAIDFLKTKTSHPLTYAVITHPNPDKFNGIATFQAQGAKVIASSATSQNMPAAQAYKQYYFVEIAKIFTNETYPKMGSVNETFGRTRDLILQNGETIHLEELQSPGVSTNQTVAFIPRVNALIVGDLVHHKAHAWLEGGIVNGKPQPTLDGWIADLRQLQAEHSSQMPLVYGGRGETSDLNTAVNEQINYLIKAQSIVSNYVHELGDRRAELNGPAAGAHYAAIQKIFEGAFPDYGLGYMIQYGVYGLVNSINSTKE